MILFCEECGKKTFLDDNEITKLQGGFACQHCDFITPVSSIEYQLQHSKPTFIEHQSPKISWSPRVLAFGKVENDQKSVLRLRFSEQNDFECNLVAKILQELSADLKIVKINGKTFDIHLLQVTGEKNDDYHTRSKDVVVSFYDAYSSFSCEVKVTFERLPPMVKGFPSRIEIGNIYSGVVYRDYLIAENSADETIKLHLKLEPLDFTIAARFVVEDALGFTMAPYEKRRIPYSLWPIEEISEDWDFLQHISVVANSSSKEINKKIEIRGKVLATKI